MLITPIAIEDAITTAPAWALIGLTVPQERLRTDARAEVAQHLFRSLAGQERPSADQLALPL